MKPKVVGVVGRNGSGKDEVLNYLQAQCGIAVVSSGDVARDIAKTENIAPTRENLHDISLRYMKERGNDFFARRLIAKIEENSWSDVGITGVRTPHDVEAFRAHFGDNFWLVAVRVWNPGLRFGRIRSRGTTRDPQTWDAFSEQEQAEERHFQISRTLQEAEITIDNSGAMSQLHQKIEASPIWSWIC
ncbi:MAG: AAA family ATPase [Deltaproteobacteria bacterium]|nr:AAA family ATPase [Deltaproteobacteria bacterium]